MIKWIKRIAALSLLPLLLLCTAAYVYRHAPEPGPSADTIYLLVPDGVDETNMIVSEWMSAGSEEGLHLSLLHDSEFLNPMRQERGIHAIIVPDLIHRVANGSLTGALHEFVQAGGSVMVVYDACTLDLDNNYTKVESRLSDLAGVSYSLYDKFQTDSIHWSPVWGSREVMQALQVPPGKYIPAHDTQLGAAADESPLSNQPQPGADDFIFSRYEYGNLEYPSFRTTATYDGKVLLQSRSGVIAGTHDFGTGKVLFVNVPLGFLESRTDGLLMHSFLHYFAVSVLQYPHFSAVPDAIGGLIFNWHIDARSAIGPLDQLLAHRIFDNGPFSIHFTAGPDVDIFGDHKGLNVGNDPQTDHLIALLQDKGHVVGSHGGWIHNYFGEHVDANNEGEYQKYLKMNVDALTKVSGHRINEYSAPLGNHPQWVSRWLEENHIDSFYFAGDTGMGPTQVYRDNSKDGENIWAFPVSHLGKFASLEEMQFANLPAQTAERWMEDIADFTANSRTARLIYTHPLGATQYLLALEQFMQHTQGLQQAKSFRWYTMSSLADFLNRRKAVKWSVNEKASHSVTLDASSPDTLEHAAWEFPASKYDQPKIREGRATVTKSGDNWIIDVANCKRIVADVRLR